MVPSEMESPIEGTLAKKGSHEPEDASKLLAGAMSILNIPGSQKVLLQSQRNIADVKKEVGQQPVVQLSHDETRPASQ